MSVTLKTHIDRLLASAHVRYRQRDASVARCARLEKYLLRNPRKISPKKLKLMEEMEAPELAKFIVDIYTHLEPETREVLKSLLNEWGFTGEFMGQLKSPEAGIRAQMAEVLGLIGMESALEPLLNLLADPEETVALAASRALVQLSNNRVLPLLVAALFQPDVWLPARVAEVLTAFGERAVPFLLQALSRENVVVRGRIIEILGEIGSARAAPMLMRVLADPAVSVRAKAAEALGKLRDHRSEKALQKALKDVSWQVRCRAARSLGQIGAVGALEALEVALKDPEWWVRVNACEALEALKAMEVCSDGCF